MNFSQTIKQIEKSPAFANFKKQYEDAYLCAGFFVLDYESSDEQCQQQLDYSLKDGTIFTFILNSEITIKKAETIKKEKLPELNKKIKVDLDDVEKILGDELQNKKIKNKINKIIAVLQNYQGKQIWNLNCILAGMEILQMHINSETGEILKSEKRSMFDFIKKIK